MTLRQKAGVSVLLVVTALVGSLLAAREAPRWLDVGRLDRPAQWAFVLGGSPEDRATAAATLWKAGWVQGVLLTRVRRIPDVASGLRPPQELIAHHLLRDLGVPSDRIRLLEGEVDSTRDEAMLLRRFLEAEGTGVIVVTEDYHTRRTRLLLRRVLGRDAPVQIVGCPSSDARLDTGWWREPVRAHVILSEMIKLAVYTIRR